jgi:hypothetical protein
VDVKADWAKLQAEYITGIMSLRDLATNHGIKAAGVMARAAKEGWDDLRKQHQAKVSTEAIQSAEVDKAEELRLFNAQCLEAARLIRQKAWEMMGQGGNSPQDMRALASSIESAQKIGRLALGATTDNSDLNLNLPALEVEFVKAE